MLDDINKRARVVLSHIVETYLGTGEAIGSRTLSKMEDIGISPASVRNVMADLEDAGLLYSPHTSSGRLPTPLGLKFFIDGILEVGKIGEAQRHEIDLQCRTEGRNMTKLLENAGDVMSNISLCAGLVMAPKLSRNLKHMEFIRLSLEQAIVVMVDDHDMVENRLISLPKGLPANALTLAGNYISSHLKGRDLQSVKQTIEAEISSRKAQIDEISARLIAAGLDSWSEIEKAEDLLVVRGQANLLNDVSALADIERVKNLFTALEGKENLLKLLKATDGAKGVKIFIGAETRLFGISDCAMIVAPYTNAEKRIIGAIGVVGPLRINYANIIPMVDYTAEVVSKLIGRTQ